MADALNLSGLETLSHPDAPPLFTTKPPEWIATYLPRYCLAASDRTVHDSRGLALIVRELHRDNLWQQMFSSWDECCQALFRRPAAWVAQVVEGVRVLHGQGHSGAIPAHQALAVKAQTAKPRATHGEIGRGRASLDRVANGHSKPASQLSSNSWERILPRLARDAPEVLERVKAGEFRSARAAAIEAGIIKPVPTIRITNDMPAVAAKLCQHLTREQRIQLIDLLAPEL
jgi:hypothetical protein